jgi:uncharacterized protein
MNDYMMQNISIDILRSDTNEMVLLEAKLRDCKEKMKTLTLQVEVLDRKTLELKNLESHDFKEDEAETRRILLQMMELKNDLNILGQALTVLTKKYQISIDFCMNNSSAINNNL